MKTCVSFRSWLWLPLENWPNKFAAISAPLATLFASAFMVELLTGNKVGLLVLTRLLFVFFHNHNYCFTNVNCFFMLVHMLIWIYRVTAENWCGRYCGNSRTCAGLCAERNSGSQQTAVHGTGWGGQNVRHGICWNCRSDLAIRVQRWVPCHLITQKCIAVQAVRESEWLT